MPLSDEDKAEIQKEIAEARRILKEDAQLSHYKRMDERWTRVHGPDPAGEPSDSGNPDQPPAPDPKPDEPPSKKKGIWWGDAID